MANYFGLYNGQTTVQVAAQMGAQVAQTQNQILIFTAVTNGMVQTAATLTDYYAWASGAIYAAGQTAWFATHQDAGNQWQGGIYSQATRQRTAEEEAAWKKLHDEQLEIERQAMERRRLAAQKAEDLLLAHLTPHQRRMVRERGYFDVVTNGRRYRIHSGTHGNVRRIEKGQETMLLCAQPEGVPTCDAMLAQKLMLETDEAAFLRVANQRRL